MKKEISKLQKALEEKNETPERLAAHLYVDPRSVKNWIEGKHKPRSAVRIAIGGFLGIVNLKELEKLFK